MRTKRGASAIGALSTTGYRIVRDHGDSLIHPFSTESLSICCAVPDTAIGLGVQEDRQKSLLNPCRAILTGRRATPLQCYVTCSQALEENEAEKGDSQHSVRKFKGGKCLWFGTRQIWIQTSTSSSSRPRTSVL